MELTTIAHIYNDYPAKFGIPRQSGLVKNQSVIIFEPKYQNPDAIRGLEEYSYLWLIWCFSEVHQEDWSPTVRPPRLGGNKRVGVFATRSPFRPNPLGLSSVGLEKVEYTEEHGIVLVVTGADLMSGTPIYDIKPYLPYVDSHSEAKGGFSDEFKDYHLQVAISEKIKNKILEKIHEKSHDEFLDESQEKRQEKSRDVRDDDRSQEKRQEMRQDVRDDKSQEIFQDRHWNKERDDSMKKLAEKKLAVLIEILSQDPRPSYQKNPQRIYGMEYAGLEIKFQVTDGILTVCQVD